jgi:hypothetical protein
VKDFRDLKVWERAHRLTLDLYEVTRGFPREELYGLTSHGHPCNGVRGIGQVPIANCCLQNFVTSVKLKSFTFIGGATISKDSSPLARTGVPIASTFESM